MSEHVDEHEDEDDGEYEYFEDEVHRYVQYRLGHMVSNPEKYGQTREAVILQLMLIAEFALLTLNTSDDPSFAELLLMFEDATLEPQRKPEHDWIRDCATATGAYIGMKIMAAQAMHQATCPNCGPNRDCN
jgi:hypothetical protein